MSNAGQIETFTILHVTPEGFFPPLALALIRDQSGRLIMAQGHPNQLKIGREVYLKQANGFYLFTLKSGLKKVHEYVTRLLRRVAAPFKVATSADNRL